MSSAVFVVCVDVSVNAVTTAFHVLSFSEMRAAEVTG